MIGCKANRAEADSRLLGDGDVDDERTYGEKKRRVLLEHMMRTIDPKKETKRSVQR